MGNLNYNKQMQGTQKQVYEDYTNHINVAAEGGGYWLVFGCEIPRNLPVKNMRSIMRVIKTSAKYPIN